MKLRDHLAEKFDAENDSPKQFILDLWKKHNVLGELQARGLSQAHDALVKLGKNAVDALKAVVTSYDKGSLTFPGGGVVKPVVVRRLSDAPADLNGKSKIIWLFREGTISEREMRLAAQKHDALGGGNDPSEALFAVGAANAFTAEEVVDHLLAAQEADDPADAPVIVDPGTDGPAPVPNADDLALLHASVLASAIAATEAVGLPNILEMNGDKAVEVVAGCETLDQVAHLEALESLNPKYPDGRKGVLEMIEKMLDQLTPEQGEDEVVEGEAQ